MRSVKPELLKLLKLIVTLLADRPEKGCFLGPVLYALVVAYSAGPLLFGLGLMASAIYTFLRLMD